MSLASRAVFPAPPSSLPLPPHRVRGARVGAAAQQRPHQVRCAAGGRQVQSAQAGLQKGRMKGRGPSDWALRPALSPQLPDAPCAPSPPLPRTCGWLASSSAPSTSAASATSSCPRDAASHSTSLGPT